MGRGFNGGMRDESDVYLQFWEEGFVTLQRHHSVSSTVQQCAC